MELNAVAEEIIHNIKTKYLDSNGMVSKTYPAGKETLYADLDDILPFMLYYGEREFIRNQIELSKKVTFKGMTTFNNKIISWRQDEYLGALCSYYRLFRDEDVKKLIQESFSSIQAYLIWDFNIVMCYDLSRREALPLISAWSGGLIEVFFENSDLFPKWREVGIDTADYMLMNDSFLKYGVFNFKSHTESEIFNYLNYNLYMPSDKINQLVNAQFYYLNRDTIKNKVFESMVYMFLQLPTGALFQFMKANSNLIFALITGYRITRQTSYRRAIKRWINSIVEKMYSDGLVYGLWHPLGNCRNPSFTESFVMIDILCDTYHFVTQDMDYLEMARDIADRWLYEQWENGLVPDIPRGKRNHLDNQTDFSISLKRLSELTGYEKYKEAGRAIFESALKYHKTEDGYVTSVSINGKSVIGSPISPKYNGLLLKGIICWNNEQRKIYSDPEFYDLMKDR